MASHGITDLAAVINIPKAEYEDLIRDSETLNVVRRILEKITDDVTVGYIKDIVGIERREKYETKIIGNDYAGNCYHIESDDD